ncbi:hypothetical protein BSK50_30380 [Paenibacillus odorifer]|nr:hypothetical protein BSK50_30380 [Paenibacillus odorifer]
MLEIFLSLIFTFALAQSNIQTANEIRESKNTMPIEKKVVQTVKAEKEKEAVKVKPKAVTVETKKEDIEEVWHTYKATAFTNHYASTGKNKGDKDYGITATGEPTKEGVTIAADWSVLPPNTVVYIQNIGYRTVTDRGGGVKGKHIDLYFESERDALEFGRHDVKLKIIKLGDKKD